MLSNASDDLPEPIGPVTTVSAPNDSSTSRFFRLFWRAPRRIAVPGHRGQRERSVCALSRIYLGRLTRPIQKQKL